MDKKCDCILFDKYRNKAVGRFKTMQEALKYAREEQLKTVTWEFVEDAKAGDIYDEPPYSKEELEAAKMQVTLDDWDEYQRYHDSRDFEAGDVYEEEAE